MPNHIVNHLSFLGEADEVQRLRDAIKSTRKTYQGEEYETPIDFNKIIPMPESLNITSGSSTTDARDCMEEIMKKADLVDTLWNKDGFQKLAEETLKRYQEQCAAATIRYLDNRVDIEFLKKLAENLIVHKCESWYPWANHNWGTKWNAYDTKDTPEHIEFRTAWSTPELVMKKLSSMFPAVQLKVVYADEDKGHNCGYYIIKGGKTTYDEDWSDTLDGFNLAMALHERDVEAYIKECYTDEGDPDPRIEMPTYAEKRKGTK